MNVINILGNIGQKPELKTVGQNNTVVCNFSVGVQRKMNRDVTDWFNCTAFGKTAETIATYFDKGSKIALTGEIQFDNFTDKDGNKRTSTKLIVTSFYFCESGKKKEQSNELDFMASMPVNVVDDMPF